ncbi:MAG: hypothetical protein COX70_01790 [Flavobacteriales bacterium CG_4_10_14_0_2_um_filter_32_8]|nr:MAG: hypothetical protein COX70_01790 [Flavobacteriales bacterium CG_4_10_14_0_2_um_filter_32_8]PJB14283.1 MAG: hypothetical protein CO118_09405 [Flavobacteriales bacterium CG_4_9_14_3_um_filter_32_8]
MKKSVLIIITIFFVFLTSFSFNGGVKEATLTTSKFSIQQYTNQLYNCIHEEQINLDAFEIALKGYFSLLLDNELGNTKYLTIIDMSLSANAERFFVIDMETQQLVFKSLVAHGRNSGEEFASHFSNNEQSYQTSIGFYKTAETYDGKKGFSLKLDGLEYSNSNARDRGIIIHGAEYVSEQFVKNNTRLGRSLGCPSLPMDTFKKAIEFLKEGSCLFIYYPQKYYLSKSKFVNAKIDYLLTNSGLFVGLE